MKKSALEGLRKKLLSDYGAFVEGMFYYLNNETPMMKADHHNQICESLTEVMFNEGYDNNLLINIAPRSGKTMLCVVYLVPFMFALSSGKAKILLGGYSTTLSKTSLKDAVAIMKSPVYKMLFPASTVSRFSDGKIEMEKGGEATPISPMSSLTGLGAGLRQNGYGYNGCIIIDDILNRSDSFSATGRQRANEWYNDSLQSRKNDPKTPIICIAQRIHEEDLPAMIMENEGDRFKQVVIPTIDEEKEKSFWESKYPYEKMMELRDKNPFLYNTQYQQSPVSKGSGILTPNMIHYYLPEELPPYNAEDIFITADTAFTVSRGSDYSVFQVWISVGHGDVKRIYLLDQIRGKYESMELLHQAKMVKERFNCSNFYIEHAASGIGLIQQLQGFYARGEIIKVKRGAKENKTSRAHEAGLYMAQGRVLIPRYTEFTKPLVDELLSFSQLLTHRHDDQVDALADAVHISLVEDPVASIGDWTGHLGF